MSSVEYNDDLGCETIKREYKLLIFNPIIVEPEQCIELLRSGRWIFNKSTELTIRNYLRIYLPKYIATYTHPLTRIENGEFYLGVNDDGIIYGIPYIGAIPIEIIQEEIHKIFDSMIRLRGPVPEILHRYKEKISIKVLKVKTNFIPERNLIYEEFIEKSNEIMRKHELYIQKKRKKEQLVIKYTSKLHEMLNDRDIREDITNYIREKSGYQKKYFKTKFSSVYHLCDVRDYYDFIFELKSFHQYKGTKHEEIDTYKEDPTSIFYWVTKWKDSKNAMLKQFKPKSPKMSNCKNYPMFLLSQVHRMIPIWCRANPQLKVYMIKINIPGNLDSNSIIEYLDLEGNWIESYRKIEYGQPQSCPTSYFF